MKIVRTVAGMQRLARKALADGRTIGLVPTMGYLHQGHLSLIERARKEVDLVVVTIFVNPTQFAPGEDLGKYPRDERSDLKKIKNVGGDIVFIPKPDDMYPSGFTTFITVEDLSRSLEGVSRPAHFRGVATVVAKLYNIIRPDVAVFGMKDFQQSVVLRRLTQDMGYPIKLIIAPTFREKDGLAMSSRNAYLSASQRKEAICLYRSLLSARSMVRSDICDIRKIEKEMRAVIRSTSSSVKIDYISFNDLKSLATVPRVVKNTVCSLAVKLGKVRLIDNLKLK